MDQATLVEIDVSAGLHVLQALDRAGFKVAVALWMLSSDQDDWRLVVSSPKLDQVHPLSAYEQVAEVLRDKFAHGHPPLLIVPTRDPLIRELRASFGRTQSVAGMRLGGQTIGERFISDAYVYRIA